MPREVMVIVHAACASNGVAYTVQHHDSLRAVQKNPRMNQDKVTRGVELGHVVDSVPGDDLRSCGGHTFTVECTVGEPRAQKLIISK